MSRKTKHALILIVTVLAFGLVGHMDMADEQCSWNGCGDARFTQE